MRFRAKIVDLACLNHFSRIINTIARLTKSCILRLTVCKLYFILSDKVANGGASMWCELSQGNFFDEFQMEGVAAEHNEIYLELVPENLSRALKTAQSAKAVKIKLTNKHCPCLRVAVELPSLSSSSRIVTHDIPVGVIPRRMWNDFREPSVPNFDVSIYLPVLKTMKSVVERMKNLSNFIVIEANLSGEMNLKIETDLVSVTTHFKDLGNPPWASEAGKHWFIPFPLLHWRKLDNPKRRQLKGFDHNPLFIVARVKQCYRLKFWWELQILSSVVKAAVPFLKLEI
ncbi:checkpoint protein HUS1 isoform 1-T1 [Cyanocitta cristata]